MEIAVKPPKLSAAGNSFGFRVAGTDYKTPGKPSAFKFGIPQLPVVGNYIRFIINGIAYKFTVCETLKSIWDLPVNTNLTQYCRIFNENPYITDCFTVVLQGEFLLFTSKQNNKPITFEQQNTLPRFLITDNFAGEPDIYAENYKLILHLYYRFDSDNDFEKREYSADPDVSGATEFEFPDFKTLFPGMSLPENMPEQIYRLMEFKAVFFESYGKPPVLRNRLDVAESFFCLNSLPMFLTGNPFEELLFLSSAFSRKTTRSMPQYVTFINTLYSNVADGYTHIEVVLTLWYDDGCKSTHTVHAFDVYNCTEVWTFPVGFNQLKISEIADPTHQMLPFYEIGLHWTTFRTGIQTGKYEKPDYFCFEVLPDDLLNRIFLYTNKFGAWETLLINAEITENVSTERSRNVQSQKITVQSGYRNLIKNTVSKYSIEYELVSYSLEADQKQMIKEMLCSDSVYIMIDGRFEAVVITDPQTDIGNDSENYSEVKFKYTMSKPVI